MCKALRLQPRITSSRAIVHGLVGLVYFLFSFLDGGMGWDLKCDFFMGMGRWGLEALIGKNTWILQGEVGQCNGGVLFCGLGSGGVKLHLVGVGKI